MDYTLSPDYATHVGTGNRLHEENAAVTTMVSEKDMNSLIWSAMEVVKAAGLAGVQFDEAVPGTYQVLVKAIKRMTGGNVTTVNFAASPFALTADHAGMVRVDAAAGNIVINLPAANVLAGLPYAFRRVDVTANTVTVNRAGGDTIDEGGTSVPLTPKGTQQIRSDGVSTWSSVAGQSIGTGQQWQAVARVKDTVYTNTTNRPIFLVAVGAVVAGGVMSIAVEGVAQVSHITNAQVATNAGNVSALIPPWSTYVISGTTVLSAVELR